MSRGPSRLFDAATPATDKNASLPHALSWPLRAWRNTLRGRTISLTPMQVSAITGKLLATSRSIGLMGTIQLDQRNTRMASATMRRQLADRKMVALRRFADSSNLERSNQFGGNANDSSALQNAPLKCALVGQRRPSDFTAHLPRPVLLHNH